MNALLLAPPDRLWHCPACGFEDVTRGPVAGVEQRFHACRALKGLTTPMLPAGVKAKITAREREDFIGGELVQTDGDGRPIMSLVVTRDEGEDCVVYAPTATGGADHG